MNDLNYKTTILKEDEKESASKVCFCAFEGSEFFKVQKNACLLNFNKNSSGFAKILVCTFFCGHT